MMLLESIELQGYKTFAGKTRFDFAGPITCIVGPNGSGKSNIADAIRWVLGEQSYRLLRGKKTEDMIFSGSETRSRAGMASANIIFDNSTGWLPIDFSEVSIARRAYRDGTNEYLLNGQRVRLRDISELLSSSGLSERTYTIIGQGLVDAALALRAEDRRSLFEEAAGIGLYRTRREEAQRRLEATHHNIERVEDILAELRPRLRSLERQANRAAQYEQVSADLKALLLDYYGFHWYKIQSDLRDAKEAASVQESMYEAVQQEQASLENQLDQLRDQIQGTRTRLGSWHRESAQLHLQREEITRHLAVSEERVRSLIVQKQNTQDEIARIESQVTYFHEQRKEKEDLVNQLKVEFREARSQVEEARVILQKRQAERSRITARTRELQGSISKLTERQQILKARHKDRQERREQQEIALQIAGEAILQIEKTERKILDRLKKAEEALSDLTDRCSEARRNLDDHQKLRIDKDMQRRDAQDRRVEIRSDLARLSAEFDVLEKADAALTGLGEGTRLLLKEGRDGLLPGVLAAFSSRLVVPKHLEPAIAAALGGFLDSILLDSGLENQRLNTTVLRAIERLLEKDVQGVLIPIFDIKPPDVLDLSTSEGLIGLAADMVKTPPELRPVVDALLGRTVIVEGHQAARKILLNNSRVERAVTLSGEVFYATGVISVGQRSGSSTLSRPRQRRELKEKVSLQEEKLASVEVILSTLESEIKAAREKEQQHLDALNRLTREETGAKELKNQLEIERDQIRRELIWQHEQREKLAHEIGVLQTEELELTESLSQLNNTFISEQKKLRQSMSEFSSFTTDEQQQQVNFWNTQVAILETALKNARGQLEERTSSESQATSSRGGLLERVTSLTDEMDRLRKEIASLKAREGDVAEKMERLAALIEPSEAELSAAEESLNRLEKTETKARQGMSLTYRQYSQAQLNLSRIQEQLERLRDRILDDLGLVSLEYDDNVSGPTPLPLDGLVESLPKRSTLPEDMEKTIRRQRAQVKRMGAINPEAQAEFKEVKERYTFLSHQIEDLHAAEKDVKQVIAELEGIMQREFQKTFELVAHEFKDIFTRLFGGGSARLLLTDPEDLTETGIDIEARLPGRRTQGLSLLSGGERSLTAAALVFALLKVSPTPFCVLDEVDAMLDEANVGRFRDLLRELSEETQFIVITHNRNTVQAADVIYGVTMGRDSASQSISLKLDEVADVV